MVAGLAIGLAQPPITPDAKSVVLVNFLFPPPLRSGGNGALSGECLVSPPLRYGENKALETDAPSGHRSAPHSTVEKEK